MRRTRNNDTCSDESKMDKPPVKVREILVEHMKRKGLKMTRQRVRVVETFLEVGGHLSTQELYEHVRKKDRRIGYSTVSRTLKLLTECGLARETDLSDGRRRFENLYRRPRHHHIVCVKCGRTIEFFSPEFEQLQEEIVARYQFRPLRNRIQIHGICRDCQGRQTAPEEPVYDSDLILLRDALNITMETEKRRVNFYQTACEFIPHSSLRTTFRMLLKDERGHLRWLQEEWEKLIRQHPALSQAPVFLHFDYGALQRIFPSRREMKKKLAGTMGEREILEWALEVEKQAHAFFSAYPSQFNDTRGKELFEKFAEEERKHYDLVRRAATLGVTD